MEKIISLEMIFFVANFLLKENSVDKSILQH